MEESTAREGVEVDVETEAETPDAPEVEAEETEQPEAETDDTEADDAEGSEEGEGDEEQAPEVDEFDFGGNKLQLPKGSVPDELRERIESFSKGIWGDYTREKQSIAERAKSLEARERAAEKIVGLGGETLQTYSHGLQVRAELEQLGQVDLQALWQSNPDQARRISDTISRKQAEFQTIHNQLSQQEQALTQTQQAEVARRKDEGKAFIEKRVKNFTTEHLPAVLEYAEKTLGMSRQEAEEGWALNPGITLAVYEATLLRKMKEAAKKPKPVAQAKPVQPLKSKGGGNGVKLDLVRDAAKFDADEWARQRNKQLARRRAR